MTAQAAASWTEKHRFFIGGHWRAPADASRGRLSVLSPSTEKIIGWVPAATDADVDTAVGALDA